MTVECEPRVGAILAILRRAVANHLELAGVGVSK
jgi:hypothetical protein